MTDRPKRPKRLTSFRRIERTRKRAKIRAILMEYKARPCADCGESYHYCVMQFDHVRGEKKFMLSMSYRGGWGLENIREEAEKCDIVCANCHHLRSHRRMGLLGEEEDV